MHIAVTLTCRPTWKPGEVLNPGGTIDLTVEWSGHVVGRLYSGSGAQGRHWRWTRPGDGGGVVETMSEAKRAIWLAMLAEMRRDI